MITAFAVLEESTCTLPFLCLRRRAQARRYNLQARTHTFTAYHLCNTFTQLSRIVLPDKLFRLSRNDSIDMTWERMLQVLA